MHFRRTSTIDRLSSLSWSQLRLLASASILLGAASLTVALLPFRWAIRLGCCGLGDGRAEVGQVVWAVEAAARRLPWRTVCIEQGLACQRMLRRRGTDAILHYGARHAGKLEAHVWVTVGGKIVLGEEGAHNHAQLATYP